MKIKESPQCLSGPDFAFLSPGLQGTNNVRFLLQPDALGHTAGREKGQLKMQILIALAR